MNPERLRLNQGGYQGERINVRQVLDDCYEVAQKLGWNVLSIPPSDLGRLVFHSPSTDAGAPNIYISAGIHGDEPAPPLAVLKLLKDHQWPEANLWLAPCLNPNGMALGIRENPHGIDLNRDFRDPTSREVAGQIEWLKDLPHLDLCLLLHEDWESDGFYCYELNPDGRKSLAEFMVQAAGEICPIDPSPVIEGRQVALTGIIRPESDPLQRPLWPEAIWLIAHRTRLNYTMEAPSDWPLSVRVDVLVSAVRAAIHHLTTDSAEDRSRLSMESKS